MFDLPFSIPTTLLILGGIMLAVSLFFHYLQARKVRKDLLAKLGKGDSLRDIRNKEPSDFEEVA